MLPGLGIIKNNEIDTFESNSLAPYQGDTDEHTIQTSVVQEGTYALQRDTTDFSAQIESFPGDGLDNYPEIGDEFECYVRSENFGSQCDGAFRFGMQDADNGYSCRCDMNSDDIQINRVDNGSTIDHGQTYFDFVEDRWYRMHIQWDDGNTFGGEDGDITFTVEELATGDTTSVTGNDTNHTSGGIAFFADLTDTDKRWWWDGARILNI